MCVRTKEEAQVPSHSLEADQRKNQMRLVELFLSRNLRGTTRVQVYGSSYSSM